MHIAVITTAYKTPDWVLARTWASLKNQRFTDWSWLVYDDSPTDHHEVQRQIYGYQADERYVAHYHRPDSPSNGNIGLAKHKAFMLAAGDILVELDHDDELTPNALQEIHDTFDAAPYCGFVYSDWQEILPNGESGKYPEGWAFGYGTEYWLNNYGWVMRAPELNRTTLSHIVSAPNHVRAWRADLYQKIGGHDITLPIADDYDLCVRTALATRCLHIPQLLYRQHIGQHTAQRQRNGLIQELVPQIHAKYAAQIAEAYPC